MSNDSKWMLKAIEVATLARLHCRPNPWVGAVIVKNDIEIARGFTSAVGGPHAEINAIANASQRLKDATLYVTLEPCSHTGRTGPCTQEIISSGIRRVVVGVIDPDEKVRGRGIEQLREAGIEVIIGVEERAVRSQLAPYLHHRATGKPFVIAKAAVTLDGYITLGNNATPTSMRAESDWITGHAARQRVHLIRAYSDAVCVGAGTVRADDPALTVREINGRDPLRVVLGEVDSTARVNPCVQWSSSVPDLLDHLGSMQFLQLLVEGGAQVFNEFRRLDLIDEWILHVSPKKAGEGLRFLPDVAWNEVLEWTRNGSVAVSSLGADTEYVIPRAVFAPPKI